MMSLSEGTMSSILYIIPNFIKKIWWACDFCWNFKARHKEGDLTAACDLTSKALYLEGKRPGCFILSISI